MRGSAPIPSRTSSTSAPASSHSEAISLVNDSLRARKALAPFLMISAASTSTTRRGASIASYSADDRVERVRVGVRETADDDPGRAREVVDGGPLAQELRVGEDPAGRQPGRLDRPSRAADRERAADDEDVVRAEPVADRRERAVELAQVAPTVVVDGRADADRTIPGSAGDGVGDLEPAGGDGRVERLLEARLVDRDPTGPERARAGLAPVSTRWTRWPSPARPDGADEADVAGADDGERAGSRGTCGGAYQSSADAGRSRCRRSGGPAGGRPRDRVGCARARHAVPDRGARTPVDARRRRGGGRRGGRRSASRRRRLPRRRARRRPADHPRRRDPPPQRLRVGRPRARGADRGDARHRRRRAACATSTGRPRDGDDVRRRVDPVPTLDTPGHTPEHVELRRRRHVAGRRAVPAPDRRLAAGRRGRADRPARRGERAGRSPRRCTARSTTCCCRTRTR